MVSKADKGKPAAKHRGLPLQINGTHGEIKEP